MLAEPISGQCGESHASTPTQFEQYGVFANARALARLGEGYEIMLKLYTSRDVKCACLPAYNPCYLAAQSHAYEG